MQVLAITETPDRPTIETFIGLHKQNISILVLCKKGWKYEYLLNQQGIETRELNFSKIVDLRMISKLRHILRTESIKIVHTYTSNGLSNTIFALLGMDIKLIAYRGIVGNVSFFDPISWVRYLNPRIDRIICVCNAIRVHFLDMKPQFMAMPHERPVTIYKGHKLSWYQNEPADLKNFSIPDKAFVVGCVANSRPRKGIEYLINALDLLPHDISVYLLLVGRIKEKKIKRAIKRCSKKERIILTGYCENAPEISAACDVVCLPSVKREGLPRSIIEAMAYGVPPIVTNSGGSPELVEDQKSGLIIPIRSSKAIADAILCLYKDAGYKQKLGINARSRIDNEFSNDATVEQTLKLYNEVLGHG